MWLSCAAAMRGHDARALRGINVAPGSNTYDDRHALDAPDDLATVTKA